MSQRECSSRRKHISKHPRFQQTLLKWTERGTTSGVGTSLILIELHKCFKRFVMVIPDENVFIPSPRVNPNQSIRNLHRITSDGSWLVYLRSFLAVAGATPAVATTVVSVPHTHQDAIHMPPRLLAYLPESKPKIGLKDLSQKLPKLPNRRPVWTKASPNTGQIVPKAVEQLPVSRAPARSLSFRSATSCIRYPPSLVVHPTDTH